MSFAVGITHGECDSGVCPCKFVTTTSTIWTAAEHGNMEAIRTKIGKSKSATNKMDNYGYTPVHYAAQQNHHLVVDYLLSNGASPDQNCCGATPLHRAGALQSCELLVRAGADLNAQDYSFGDNNTPLQKAILGGHAEVVELLASQAGIDWTLENSAGLSVQTMLHDYRSRPVSGDDKVVDEDTGISGDGGTSPSAVDRDSLSSMIAVLKNIGSDNAVGTDQTESLNDIDVSPEVMTVSKSTETALAAVGGAAGAVSSGTCCSLCKKPSLSFARTQFSRQLICLDCKHGRGSLLMLTDPTAV